MTIECANRLAELRRTHGLSQEELAERLGGSRQSISKRERAESSPDTDNLIALAQLYGVTLDTLIYGSKPAGMMDIPHTSTADQLQEELPVTMPEDSCPEDIGPTMPESTFVEDAGPTLPVDDPDIPPETSYAIDPDDPLPNGSYFDMKRQVEEKEKERRRRRFPYPVFAAFAYLLMGFLLDWWHPGWIIFLTIPLYYLRPEDRTYRKLLGNPIMISIIYLLMGCVLGWWHPGWLIFLLIPITQMHR